MRQAKSIRPAPDFATTVARAKLTVRELARVSEVPYQTLYGALHPEHNARRRGTVSAKTAWAVAQGFAAHTGKTEQQAFDELFVVTEGAETG